MKKIFTALILALLFTTFVLPLHLVSAQEPGTTEDNWCFGKPNYNCGDATTNESKWMWTCGWYMARFERGEIQRGWIELITTCDSLLPPLPPIVIVEQPSIVEEPPVVQTPLPPAVFTITGVSCTSGFAGFILNFTYVNAPMGASAIIMPNPIVPPNPQTVAPGSGNITVTMTYSIGSNPYSLQINQAGVTIYSNTGQVTCS